jgi:hypothetical protein
MQRSNGRCSCWKIAGRVIVIGLYLHTYLPGRPVDWGCSAIPTTIWIRQPSQLRVPTASRRSSQNEARGIYTRRQDACAAQTEGRFFSSFPAMLCYNCARP